MRFDSSLNLRHILVNRVRQQQNGSAEKQCVEEKVQRIAKNSRPTGMTLWTPCSCCSFPEKFYEADDEQHQGTNIDPECRRRYAKRRESQSRYKDSELLETAHDDLQRSSISPMLQHLPDDFEERQSKAANRGK